MCGICGFIGEHARMTQATLERMNDSLVRRGPDDGGLYTARGIGMAMRRLSIIDLGGGHQPIGNEDNTIQVVYNGEIYNYRQLRESLQQRGHIFRTDSDTEVLVHLYEEYGDALVEHLEGMFAFSIWDSVRELLVIARDRLGIKPLYYAYDGRNLVYGSEIKALLASGMVDANIDYQGLDAFMAFTYIPAPLTIYREIRKLEPGHVLVYESGRIAIERYWDLDFTTDPAPDRETWSQLFDTAIDSAVGSHLVSDVPVGAFLSGGVDSSLVVALMSKYASDAVQTCTMGFGGQVNPLLDERPLAAAVAERYGCKYHEATVEPDFRSIVGEIVDAFDEPFADDSVIPTYYVSQITSEKVKVALSGLGGDELFAGYQRYTGVYLGEIYSRYMPGFLHRSLVNPLIQRLPEPSHGGDKINHAKRFAAAVKQTPDRRYLDFVSTLPPGERRAMFSPEVASQVDFEATGRVITDPFNACNANDDVSRAMYADMKTYLPEDILALSDRLSMWHSLEVRVPFLDHRLVELSARLPVRHKLNMKHKKILLKQIAARYLPEKVISHRKQGFESPMAAWLKTDLADYARDVLGPERLGATGLFDPDFVSDRLEQHMTGRQKNNKLLFSLIIFQEWYERQVA